MDGSTTVRRSADAVSQPVEGGAALLHLQTGAYHQINKTGLAIWELLAEPIVAAELTGRVAERIGHEPAEISSDVLAFVSDLHARGLVEVSEG